MKKHIFKLASALLALVLGLSFTLNSAAYTVKSGDTLSKLAREYGTSVEAIMALNNLTDKDYIYVGQNLNLGNDNYERVELTPADKAALKTLFDADWYKAAYPDVVECVGDSADALFNHFLTHGLWETRQPNANFNVNAYASVYEDLQETYGSESDARKVLDLTLHYINCGKEEGREFTTIEKALEVVDKVTYFGSFHDKDIEKTQTGDILAQRQTGGSSSDLFEPILMTYFYDSCRAYKRAFNLAHITVFDAEYDSAFSCNKNSPEFLTLYSNLGTHNALIGTPVNKDAFIELIPVEYAGQENELYETARNEISDFIDSVSDFGSIATNIYVQIDNARRNDPVSFTGYSDIDSILQNIIDAEGDDSHAFDDSAQIICLMFGSIL